MTKSSPTLVRVFNEINSFFSHQDSPTELAFKYAVYKINKDPYILSNKTLSYDIQYVPREDSFRTTNKVKNLIIKFPPSTKLFQICQQVGYGIQALFGPNDFILGSHVQSLCDALDIPHLEARSDIDNSYRESSLNLQPSQDLMNQAYKVR